VTKSKANSIPRVLNVLFSTPCAIQYPLLYSDLRSLGEKLHAKERVDEDEDKPNELEREKSSFESIYNSRELT
jgi:hypothetical protein